MEQKRIEYIDTAKGLCIMLVVLSHVWTDIYGLDYPLSRQLEPVRMPLYFVLSGLFFKLYDGFFDFVRRKVNKILIPFLCFFVLTVGTENLLMPYLGDAAMHWQGPLWFLLCLFDMNLIFYLLRKCVKSDVWLVVVCLSLGVVFSHVGRLPLRIATAFSCLPFFAFGYILRNRTSFLSSDSSVWQTVSVVVFTGILTTMTGGFCLYRENYFEMNIASLYACGVCGTMTILMLSRHLGLVPFVSFVGRYSIIILVVHYTILKLLTLLLPSPFTTGYVYADATLHYVLTLGASALLVFPLKRYLPWMVAQSDLWR